MKHWRVLWGHALEARRAELPRRFVQLETQRQTQRLLRRKDVLCLRGPMALIKPATDKLETGRTEKSRTPRDQANIHRIDLRCVGQQPNRAFCQTTREGRRQGHRVPGTQRICAAMTSIIVTSAIRLNLTSIENHKILGRRKRLLHFPMSGKNRPSWPGVAKLCI